MRGARKSMIRSVSAWHVYVEPVVDSHDGVHVQSLRRSVFEGLAIVQLKCNRTPAAQHALCDGPLAETPSTTRTVGLHHVTLLGLEKHRERNTVQIAILTTRRFSGWDRAGVDPVIGPVFVQGLVPGAGVEPARPCGQRILPTTIAFATEPYRVWSEAG